MLIIFDLDDTLIDTTGSITPYILKNVYDDLLKMGMSNKNFNHLLQLSNTKKSTKAALKSFLYGEENFNFLFDKALDLAYEKAPLPEKVDTKMDAIKILNHLKKDHFLALATVGKEKRQLSKLEKAGIDTTFFSIIEIVDDENKNKKPAYKKIIEMLQMNACDTLVCGDKVDIDLLPAKTLGCYTAYISHGKRAQALCATAEENKMYVDFEIKKLNELIKILQTIGEK